MNVVSLGNGWVEKERIWNCRKCERGIWKEGMWRGLVEVRM